MLSLQAPIADTHVWLSLGLEGSNNTALVFLGNPQLESREAAGVKADISHQHQFSFTWQRSPDIFAMSGFPGPNDPLVLDRASKNPPGSAPCKAFTSNGVNGSILCCCCCGSVNKSTSSGIGRVKCNGGREPSEYTMYVTSKDCETPEGRDCICLINQCSISTKHSA